MDTAKLPIVPLSGSPRERGRQHGEHMRENIRAATGKWLQYLRAQRGCDPVAYLADFAAYGRFGEAIDRWAPDLREEIEGISEGSGVALDILFPYQLPDEEWVYAFYVRTLQTEVPEKCTAFALHREGESVVGQNMDVPSLYEGHQVLLRIAPREDEPETLVYTAAGLLALTGMNAAPLGLCMNTLMELRPSRSGLPVAFIVRKVLQKSSAKDAREFLGAIRHASGQNYTVGDRREIISLECSSTAVAELRLRDDHARVCHTNHAVVNADRAPAWPAYRDANLDAYARSRTNSQARFASMEARVVLNDRVLAHADLTAALSAKDDRDHSVSRPLSAADDNTFASYTAGSVIYELSENPCAFIASGAPCSTPFRKFEFSA